MKVVLITGGTGLIGQQLSQLLAQEGYKVIHLSRKENLQAVYPAYRWNLDEQFLDSRAIAQADYIIHLAGASVADKRWTDKQKQIIIDSRVKSAKLLYESLQATNHHVQKVISASGVGFYGNSGDKWMSETDKPAKDCFLTEVCQLWENSIQEVEKLNIPTVVLRIGLVLTTQGGVLPKLDLPVKFGISPYFGNGQQYYSWIHAEDLCRMFLHCLEAVHLAGVYNAASPYPVTNKEMVKHIAQVLGRPFIGIPLPVWGLKLGMGELSTALLYSNRAKVDKIMNSNFSFRYPKLTQALKQLYEK